MLAAVIVKPNHKRAVTENHRPFCLISQVARDDISRRAKGPSAILRVGNGDGVSVLVETVVHASP